LSNIPLSLSRTVAWSLDHTTVFNNIMTVLVKHSAVVVKDSDAVDDHTTGIDNVAVSVVNNKAAVVNISDINAPGRNALWAYSSVNANAFASSNSPSHRDMTQLARQLPITFTEVRAMSISSSMP
jgi:hypothetical protein